MADEKRKVWIELEKPKSMEHAEAQCEFGNRILKKLMIWKGWEFWASDRRGRIGYCLTIDSAGGFLELTDHGHWFQEECMEL